MIKLVMYKCQVYVIPYAYSITPYSGFSYQLSCRAYIDTTIWFMKGQYVLKRYSIVFDVPRHSLVLIQAWVIEMFNVLCFPG